MPPVDTEKSTQFKEVKIVAISAVIAALIALALIKLLQPPPSQVHIFSDTDDAPIIMAGGSLYIGTGTDGVFNRDSAKATLVYTAGLKVFGIDLINKEDALQQLTEADVSSATGRVDLTYCKLQLTIPPAPPACSGNSDTVTLTFDNTSTGGPIVISNKLSVKIGAAPRILPTLWMHMRKGWTLFHVEATAGTTTKKADCGSGSECNIVVHTCLKGTGCTASQ
jgi:hypothetical protein